MENGASDEIEYTFTDGTPRYAVFRETYVTNPGEVWQSTYEPNWYVWHKNDGNNGKFEWLNYLTLDSSLWSAKLHCQYGLQSFKIPLPWIDWDLKFNLGPGEPRIKCWFEHKPFGGGQSHDDIVIRFLDWNRNPWEAEVNVVKGTQGQPTFNLRKLW